MVRQCHSNTMVSFLMIIYILSKNSNKQDEKLRLKNIKKYQGGTPG